MNTQGGSASVHQQHSVTSWQSFADSQLHMFCSQKGVFTLQNLHNTDHRAYAATKSMTPFTNHPHTSVCTCIFRHKGVTKGREILTSKSLNNHFPYASLACCLPLFLQCVQTGVQNVAECVKEKCKKWSGTGQQTVISPSSMLSSVRLSDAKDLVGDAA